MVVFIGQKGSLQQRFNHRLWFGGAFPKNKQCDWGKNRFKTDLKTRKKEINTFIHQGCIKLIKSKDLKIYISNK